MTQRIHQETEASDDTISLFNGNGVEKITV